MSEIGNFTPDELKQYEESMKDMSDYYNIIETAAEEAEKRGHARGREEGREEARLETAIKLKEHGFDTEIIVAVTSLDAETIGKL